jgi:hypothetical protein
MFNNWYNIRIYKSTKAVRDMLYVSSTGKQGDTTSAEDIQCYVSRDTFCKFIIVSHPLFKAKEMLM